MLERTIESTKAFIETMPKAERKAYGQFFTTQKTASFMASLFQIDLSLPQIKILDAGAGTGVLSAALAEKILQLGYTGNIHFVCYESDSNVLPVLISNLESMSHGTNITFEVFNENYLTSPTNEELFDYVIGNPPYKKIGKSAPEALNMPHVCHGAPNLYFLFWAKALASLKEGMELVYIVPRSWTSGAYFAKFREYLFEHSAISHIHLFASRNKIFGDDNILQETMIVKVRKCREHPAQVVITSSSNSDFSDVRTLGVPYNIVVAKNHYVFLVKDENEAQTLDRLSHFNDTLSSIACPMKTGLIVDYRTREVLRNQPANNTFPLLYSQHIKNGRVEWPIGKVDEYICTNHPAHLQVNANYLLVKRITAKEEHRRLQCGIYLQSDHTEFKFLSTHNKVNFIKCDTPELTYGMYVLLNSTLYDTYYRILNGSTQVNSTEINNMPVPDVTTIKAMGTQLMGQDLTESNCNKIIEQWIK